MWIFGARVRLEDQAAPIQPPLTTTNGSTHTNELSDTRTTTVTCILHRLPMGTHEDNRDLLPRTSMVGVDQPQASRAMLGNLDTTRCCSYICQMRSNPLTGIE